MSYDKLLDNPSLLGTSGVAVHNPGTFYLLLTLLAAWLPASVGHSAPLPADAAPPTPAARPTDALTQGRYVALAADCASCHTAPDGKPFAGGAPLKSTFGTVYGPNITQDVVTGIGSWTEADFERALRRGIRKDGAYLYPAMPYDAYTKISASDMAALWTYIKSIAAVPNQVPANTLPFPLTIRSGMAV